MRMFSSYFLLFSSFSSWSSSCSPSSRTGPGLSWEIGEDVVLLGRIREEEGRQKEGREEAPWLGLWRWSCRVLAWKGSPAWGWWSPREDKEAGIELIHHRKKNVFIKSFSTIPDYYGHWNEGNHKIKHPESDLGKRVVHFYCLDEPDTSTESYLWFDEKHLIEKHLIEKWGVTLAKYAQLSMWAEDNAQHRRG